MDRNRHFSRHLLEARHTDTTRLRAPLRFNLHVEGEIPDNPRLLLKSHILNTREHIRIKLYDLEIIDTFLRIFPIVEAEVSLEHDNIAQDFDFHLLPLNETHSVNRCACVARKRDASVPRHNKRVTKHIQLLERRLDIPVARDNNVEVEAQNYSVGNIRNSTNPDLVRELCKRRNREVEVFLGSFRIFKYCLNIGDPEIACNEVFNLIHKSFRYRLCLDTDIQVLRNKHTMRSLGMNLLVPKPFGVIYIIALCVVNLCVVVRNNLVPDSPTKDNTITIIHLADCAIVDHLRNIVLVKLDLRERRH